MNSNRIILLSKRVRKKIERFNHNRNLNKVIKKYKYVHVMVSDKFTEPFIDFVNSCYDKNEHIFLVKNNGEFDVCVRENVKEIFGIEGLDFGYDRNQKVFFHSLFLNGVCEYLFFHRNLLKKKAYWIIWGGDLYEAKRDPVNDYVRRNFHGYISDTDGDCEVTKEKYKIKKAYFYNGAYTFPVQWDMIEVALEEKKHKDCVRVQVNNSCDRTTSEMLKKLSKFRNENIEVTTVLSYGDMEYKEAIMETGKQIFGDKFVPLSNYLSPMDYAKWCAQNDVYVLSQDRQQGLGNSFITLATGGKLYIKSEITTFSHFKRHDIEVFDTNEIEDMNFTEFTAYPDSVKKQNMENVKCFFDDRYLKELWSPIFEESC